MVEEQKLTSCLWGCGHGRVTRSHALTNCRVGAELMSTSVAHHYSSAESSHSFFLAPLELTLQVMISLLQEKCVFFPAVSKHKPHFNIPRWTREWKEDLSQLLIFIYIAAVHVMVVCVMASYILL